MATGWIYILSNPDMPGLVKIGQTGNDPSVRASELYTTGVPSPFRIEYKGIFEDYASLERHIHSALSDVRNSQSREFFRIDVQSAIVKIRSLAKCAPIEEKVYYLNPQDLEKAERKQKIIENQKSIENYKSAIDYYNSKMIDYEFRKKQWINQKKSYDNITDFAWMPLLASIAGLFDRPSAGEFLACIGGLGLAFYLYVLRKPGAEPHAPKAPAIPTLHSIPGMEFRLPNVDLRPDLKVIPNEKSPPSRSASPSLNSANPKQPGAARLAQNSPSSDPAALAAELRKFGYVVDQRGNQWTISSPGGVKNSFFVEAAFVAYAQNHLSAAQRVPAHRT